MKLWLEIVMCCNCLSLQVHNKKKKMDADEVNGANKRVCSICKLSDSNQYAYGEWKASEDYTVHYFCAVSNKCPNIHHFNRIYRFVHFSFSFLYWTAAIVIRSGTKRYRQRGYLWVFGWRYTENVYSILQNKVHIL